MVHKRMIHINHTCSNHHIIVHCVNICTLFAVHTHTHIYIYIFTYGYHIVHLTEKRWFKTTMLYHTFFACLGSSILGNSTINLFSDALNLAVCIKNSCVMQYILRIRNPSLQTFSFNLKIGNSIIIFFHLTQHWRMSLKHFDACVFWFFMKPYLYEIFTQNHSTYAWLHYDHHPR